MRNLDDAKTHIKERLEAYEPPIGRWLVELKSTKTPIGICGLYKRDYSDELDIGFAYLPQYVGKGYGYEAAQATLDYGFNVLKLTRIDAYVKKENIASIALLKKLGLTFVKEVEPSKGDVVSLFSIVKN